ncbi:MAG: nuclear transport factor 2 family protein [Mycobacteriales bacterium]
MTITDTAEAPRTDNRDPVTLVPTAIQQVLRLAGSWLAWDGAPRYGDGNVWTPHKALRRVNDHLLDHLAEIDALLAGAPTTPDTWHGRTVTLDADWARFTEPDLDEAASRLRRYAELYRLRLTALSDVDLDRDRPPAWTIRQITHHVANVVYYARQVGDLTSQQAATAADADFVFTEWDRRTRAGDIDGLLELYTPDAVFESPLAARILDQPSGVLRGHDQLRVFFERGTHGRPHDLARFWRTGRYQFDGHTLTWEYPRATPDGDQLDLVEIMDLAGPRITHHRIYWGWAGTPQLTRNNTSTTTT